MLIIDVVVLCRDVMQMPRWDCLLTGNFETC